MVSSFIRAAGNAFSRGWKEAEAALPEPPPKPVESVELKVRPLSSVDLNRLVAQEFDETLDTQQHYWTIKSEGRVFYIDKRWGSMYNYCIHVEGSFGVPPQVAALTFKYLIEANEKHFHRVANHSRTTRS